MATAGINAVPKASRLDARDRYGDARSSLHNGDTERGKGQLENAWTAYQLAFELWVREQYLNHKGKQNTSLNDPMALLEKLRGGGAIDRWTFDALRLFLKRPLPVEWIHADVAAALMQSLIGGEACPRV